MVRIVLIGDDKCFRLKSLEQIEDCIINIIPFYDDTMSNLPKDVIDLFIVECHDIKRSEIICLDIKINTLLNHIPLIYLTNNINHIPLCDIFVSNTTSNIEFIYQVKLLLKMKLMDDEIKKEKILLELKVKDRTNELEEKAEKLKITLNSIGDGVIVTDQNGLITTMNPIAMEVTELSIDDYYNKHIDDVLDISINGNKLNIYKYFLEINKSFSIEEGTILRSKNGKIIRISDSVSPMINKNGDLNGIVVAFRDITNEYELRNKIINSEKNYRRIFNNVPDIIFTTDITGNFTSINSINTFGFNNLEILGKNINIFISSNDDILKINKNIISKLLDKTKVTEYNINILSKNGKIIPIEIKSQIVVDDNNNPIEIFGIARDITYRIETEKIIQESQERYKNIFDNMDCAVGVLKTPNGKNFYFIEWNKKAIELEKKHINNVIGKELYEIFPEYEKDGLKDCLKHVWDTEQPMTIDDYYHESNLTNVKGWRKFYIYKLKKSNEIVVIGEDITERKNYEQVLKEAIQKAENSDKLKSIFLSNMSHEIRTPLNAIIGFSNQLITKQSSKNTQEYVNIIQSSGNLLITLIDDILDLSKIEVGDIKIINKSFNLNEMLFQSKQEYEILSKTKNKEQLNIKLIIPDEDIIVTTDYIRLKQVINNLMSNSIKFTQKGYIKYGYVIKNNFIEFFVKDTGMGISSENIDKIFDRFTQIHNKSHKKQEGTGLGLTISKAIIELLGGSMNVISKIDKGTTFYFTIPYEENKINIPKKISGKIKKYNWFGNRMIIIDDNDTNFNISKIILETTKIEIIRYNNEEEFIKNYKNNIDLVLISINLIDIKDCELIKHIRLNDKHTPIILITSFNDNDMYTDSNEILYIPKPINWNILKSKIDELLKK